MRTTKKSVILFLFIILGSTQIAQATTTPTTSEQAFEKSLHYQNGNIKILGNRIQLNLSNQYRFLNQKDARRVLEEAWGNPPDESVLGMIFPSDTSPTARDSWGVVVTYSDEGYVKDDDAAKINYDELLKQMQTSSNDSNQEREKQGYEKIQLMGWATKPHYEAKNHKLFWAKELRFGNEKEHTLNYFVRVLGRTGVLELNAVASMNDLPRIEKSMQALLPQAEFLAGNRYEDFKPGRDKVSEYGIAALVAGGLLAGKLGLFAKLGVMLLGLKKLLIPIVVFGGSFIARLFGRKKPAA